MPNKLEIYSDGGARGNPGPAGIGVVVYDPSPLSKDEGRKKLLKKHKEYIGERTNNEAEYLAVIKALELAYEAGAERVEVFVDSELIQRQLSSHYKVKKPHLQELFLKVRNLETKFKKVSFRHIPREKNQLADKLAGEAIDEQKTED